MKCDEGMNDGCKFTRQVTKRKMILFGDFIKNFFNAALNRGFE